MAESGLASWPAILDELERQLVRAAPRKLVSVDNSGVWDIRELSIPFDTLAEMPAEYAERARGILNDYDRVIAELDRARAEVAGHLSLLNALPARAAADAVYLDALG